jgi:hypothetical protein
LICAGPAKIKAAKSQICIIDRANINTRGGTVHIKILLVKANCSCIPRSQVSVKYYDFLFISRNNDSARIYSTVSLERAGGIGSERLSFARGARTLNFPQISDTRFWTDKYLELSISKPSKEIFNLK